MHAMARKCCVIWLITLFLSARIVNADEGFWLYEQLPLQLISERTGVHLTESWLLNLQQSTARYNGSEGGSATFVSADGLLLTNFHVNRPTLRKLTTPGRDLIRDGFLARTLADEVTLPGISLDVLISVTDVTAKVRTASSGKADPAMEQQARDRVIQEIERGASSAPGTAAEVVALFEGGRYVLYQYKRYTDVRLVFSPESSVVGLPSDAHPTEAEYPAPRLDFAFIRAYENNQPARPLHYLSWSKSEPTEGVPIFLSGVPTFTRRHLTVADLVFQRDVAFPIGLEVYSTLDNRLSAWATQNASNAQAADEMLVRAKYFRQMFEGILETVRDPVFSEKKRTEEEQILKELRSQSDEEGLAAFATIKNNNTELAHSYARSHLLPHGDEAGVPPWKVPPIEESWESLWSADLVGPLYLCGEILLRSHEEGKKPDGTRAKGYNESERSGLEDWLLGFKTINQDVETVRLTVWLQSLILELGVDDPVTQIALARKAPWTRAAELAHGTRLGDGTFRRELLNADDKAFEAARDPLLDLLRQLQPEIRRVGQQYEYQAAIRGAARRRAIEALATIRDTPVYPDATRTVRMSYGKVQGFVKNSVVIPPVTTLHSVYDWSDHQYESAPYILTDPWRRARERVDQSAPLNFLTTADVIGGNSGSATVDAEGRIVGIVCCAGNPRGMASGDFAYGGGEPSRAEHVATAMMLDVLDRVYGASVLVRELSEGHR